MSARLPTSSPAYCRSELEGRHSPFRPLLTLPSEFNASKREYAFPVQALGAVEERESTSGERRAARPYGLPCSGRGQSSRRSSFDGSRGCCWRMYGPGNEPGGRCERFGPRSPAYDRGDGRRQWRRWTWHGPGGRRAAGELPSHGVTVAVPFTRHASGHTIVRRASNGLRQVLEDGGDRLTSPPARLSRNLTLRNESTRDHPHRLRPRH